jgi:cytochrome c oxidase subunit 1
VLGLGLLVALWCLLSALWTGRRAPPNPWGAASLEWVAASPPSHHNFDEPPGAVYPYDFTGLRRVSDDAGWVRTEAR